MKKTTKLALACAIAGATLGSAYAASAPAPKLQTTTFKHWLVRLRGIDVAPDVSSSTITTIGGKVNKITNQVVPELDFSYFVTPNLSAELILGTTRHGVRAKNTALDTNGSLNLGKVSLLPPTLLAQWHFLPSYRVDPYVGAGVNYTVFYHVKNGPGLNSTHYTNSWGPALQIGADVVLTGNWVVNFDVKKIWISSKVHTSSGSTRVSTKVHIDPFVYGIGIGYRF